MYNRFVAYSPSSTSGLYLLSTSAQDQDAEDKEHSQPDFANHRGVALHFIQQAAQQIPFTHFSRQLSCFLGKERHKTHFPILQQTIVKSDKIIPLFQLQKHIIASVICHFAVI